MEKLTMQFRLLKIREISYTYDFAPLTDDTVQAGHIEVGMDVALNPDLTHNRLGLTTGVRYHSEPGEVRKELLNYRISSVFEVVDLESYIISRENEMIVIRPELVTMLLGIAVGAIRGMLVLKTAGTFFDNFPLPVISIKPLLETLQNNPLQEMAIAPTFRFEL